MPLQKKNTFAIGDIFLNHVWALLEHMRERQATNPGGNKFRNNHLFHRFWRRNNICDLSWRSHVFDIVEIATNRQQGNPFALEPKMIQHIWISLLHHYRTHRKNGTRNLSFGQPNRPPYRHIQIARRSIVHGNKTQNNKHYTCQGPDKRSDLYKKHFYDRKECQRDETYCKRQEESCVSPIVPAIKHN